MNKLFIQVIEQTNSERLQEYKSQMRPMDPERRAFLEGAMKEITYNPVDKVKECIDVLKSDESDIDTKCDALEQIQFECEQIDMAANLHKINGLGYMVSLLDHENSQIRMNAAWVLATCISHNPEVQEQIKQFDILPILFKHIQHERDEPTLQKIVLCTSAMVRENEDGLKEFLSLRGTKVINEYCHQFSVKVKRKVSFLIFAILSQLGKEESTNIVINEGLLAGFKSTLDTEFDLDTVQQTLNSLSVLSPPSQEILKLAKECGLLESLKNTYEHINKNPDLKTTLEEVLESIKPFLEAI